MSIIFPLLEKQKYHSLDDFLINLFNEEAMEMFAYNFLSKLDDSLHENRRTFNLILIDDGETLK